MEKFENETRVKVISGNHIGKTCIVINERKTDDPFEIFSYKLECVDNGEIIEVLGSKLERDDQFIEMAGRIPGEAKIPGKPKSPGLIIAMGANEGEIRHFHVFRSKFNWIRWSNGIMYPGIKTA